MLVDFGVNLGLDLVKEQLADNTKKRQLEELLRKHFENYKKNREHSLLEEEVDFDGLEKYIRGDCLQEAYQCVFGATSEERGLARQTLLNKAVAFAKADNIVSKRQTQAFISTVLELIKRFYRVKANRNLAFFAGEIEDIVIAENEKTRESIRKMQEQVLRDNENKILLSTDQAIKKLAEGKADEVESKLEEFLDAISSKHDLFPHYGFRLTENNELVSRPLTLEGQMKYPENYRLRVSDIRIGERQFHEIDQETFDFSYRHQTPIVFSILSATKFLGNVIDPRQVEAESLLGKEGIIKPSEFPKARPYNVMVGKKVVVPYLLLRTQEILDDGTVVLSNNEQEGRFFTVSVRMNAEAHSLGLSVLPNCSSNRQLLDYYRVLSLIGSGRSVVLNDLEENTQVLSGKYNKTERLLYQKKTAFLRKIVFIEEYFKTKISIPDSIDYKDIVMVNRICSILQGGYREDWKKFEFEFVVSDDVRDRISELNEGEYVISYSGEAHFLLFEAELKLTVRRVIYKARVYHIEQLKAKAKVMEDGDPIKVVYVSKEGTQPYYIDVVEQADGSTVIGNFLKGTGFAN